ncbi:unnamed protein product [Ceratitis capitata]|uniref:(Mediterranean fruit fly) hypothetical protein n=1 Tax=Ceratitis capitata TaxID=7213 RepID=A0A811V7A3_CERCA|nr:unnamed protein product [Ceratitis capitata]
MIQNSRQVVSKLDWMTTWASRCIIAGYGSRGAVGDGGLGKELEAAATTTTTTIAMRQAQKRQPYADTYLHIVTVICRKLATNSGGMPPATP